MQIEGIADLRWFPLWHIPLEGTVLYGLRHIAIQSASTQNLHRRMPAMNIGIVGLGLIGGCLAIDLKALGHSVYGVARRQTTCEDAINRQLVDRADVHLTLLSECDCIFICTPIAAIVPTVQTLAEIVQADAVITDVGSVKGAIVEAATQLWPNFVGGHPMSGKSEAGLEAAESGLFQGNPYVITPLERTSKDAIALVEDIATALGSRLYTSSPADHDRAVAWISHLPVVVSHSLIRSAMNEPDPAVQQLSQQLASSGFRDTSRVGGGHPELGVMMAQYNREELLRSLHRYQQSLTETIEQIEAENWPWLTDKLSESQQARPKFV